MPSCPTAHLGDLLDFTPVPRKTARVDGWTPERQRAFIAALSATGSKRQAAMSIAMAPFGVDQMLKAEGSDSFKAAFARAMAIAQANGSTKIAQGVADAAARNAQLTPPSRLRGHSPSPLEGEDARFGSSGGRAAAWHGEGEPSEDQKLELLDSLATKFLKKVVVERKARLAGEIVAADFYLRQITVIETAFDLSAAHLGFNASEVLHDVRRGGRGLLDIVDTPFVQFLDARRREYWISQGEPMRPVAFREEFLEDHGDHRTEVSHSGTGALTTPARGFTQEEWARMDYEEQRRAREAQFQQDAAEQIAWEQQARAEWEERQSPGKEI